MVRLITPPPSSASHIFSKEALSFIAVLHRTFERRRRALLSLRVKRQTEIDKGNLPDFLFDNHSIAVRADPSWICAKPGPGLADRRVEITGPVTRKMIINALNSGAKTFMADFEDSTSPTWENISLGQANIYDAIRRVISIKESVDSKAYCLLKNHSDLAVLIIRPRGWHLLEKHITVDGEPCSASLVDFGLYFFHNAKKSIDIGHGPYFYLPKIENHLEARLWNDVFNLAQDTLSIPRGTIRATVLIETITAAFEMEEILFELRQHSAGLNCGRWDYIFSYIKKLRYHPKFVLPARSLVTMDTPFMSAYVRLLIEICHRRGVHAMGGMAAQIPIRNNKQANEEAMKRVKDDKLREVKAGHDGTWVAHPGLIPIAMEIFNSNMPGPNQLHKQGKELFSGKNPIKAIDLLTPPLVRVKMEDIVSNIEVSLIYISAWLAGNGCIPINNLMEDAATAEIARVQLWQWIKHGVKTDCGNLISLNLILPIIGQISLKHSEKTMKVAQKILQSLVSSSDMPDFLTTECYDQIIMINGIRSNI